MGVSFYICLALTYSLINPASTKDTVSQALLSSTAFLLVSVSLLSQFPTGFDLASSVGLRKTKWQLLLLGALIGALAQIPAERVHQWMLQLLPLSEEQLASKAQVFAHEGFFEAMAIGVALAVIVPIAEELFFRGAVFVALRRAGRSVVVVCLTTGIGFALCHPEGSSFLSIALVAAIFTLLRAMSVSLYPSIFAHISFNGATVLMNLVFVEEAQEFQPSFALELGLNILLIACLMAFITIASRSSQCALSRIEEGQPLTLRKGS